MVHLELLKQLLMQNFKKELFDLADLLLKK